MPGPSVIPHLIVSDGEAAIAFYEQAFGAKLENKLPTQDGKKLMHAALALNGGAVFLVDDFPEYDEAAGIQAPPRLGGTAVAIHLDVSDVDATYDRAVKAGVTTLMPVENMFWGQRYAKVRDPFGHVWSIGGPVK